MSDIPEFHGNPNDLDFNPEYVFMLKERITELENALNEVILDIDIDYLELKKKYRAIANRDKG